MTLPEFTILYDTYAPRLTYFAFNILKDKEAASEVVSKVFTKIWESGNQVDKAEMYTWVKYACIDHLRSKKVQGKKEVTTDEFDDIPDNDETDRRAIWSEYLDAIWNEVKHLPERQREIFIRTYLHGQKAPQIAREMGIKISGVTTQRQRGVQTLKKKFNQ